MMEEKDPYYRDTKKYFNTVMRGMDQEELMAALEDLNIHELKQCLAAGVPGHAMHKANEILRRQKAEIKAYIEKKGAAASATVEVETQPEDKENDVENVRSSEGEGETDSGTLGEKDRSAG